MNRQMTKPLIGIGADVKVTGGRRDRAFGYMTYIETLRSAGAVPVLIPPQAENAAAVMVALDGLVLAGGADCDPSIWGEEPHPKCEPMDPRRQSNDLALARAAHDQKVPALGVCLGLQIMNVANGGTLMQDIDSEMKTEIRHGSDPSDRARHDIAIESGTQLASILGAGTFNVNSSHHQAVRNVAKGFRVTAYAPDGIVEGLEDPRHPFYLGVQWHPEDMGGEESATGLFAAFIEAARAHALRRLGTLSPAGVSVSE